MMVNDDDDDDDGDADGVGYGVNEEEERQLVDVFTPSQTTREFISAENSFQSISLLLCV